jgi:hypothetical protein
MKKNTITALIGYFIFMTIFVIGCSHKADVVEGTIFSKTMGGDIKYAIGEDVYLFESGDGSLPQDSIYNNIDSIYNSLLNNDNNSLNIDEELWKSVNITIMEVIIIDKLDKLKIKSDSNSSNKFKIYITQTDDKGHFEYKDIPFGNYYIISKNIWNYVSYSKSFGVRTLSTGEVKLKKIVINDKKIKITL